MSYLRNRFLGTTAFLMEAEGKSATELAAEQRKDIKVQVSARSDSEKDATNEDNKEKDEDKEADSEDDDGNNDEENDENDKDKDEKIDDEDKDKEETDEQKKERLAKEKDDRSKQRMQKRIDKKTAEAETLRAENERLKKQLEADPDKTLTEEEIEKRAIAKAQELSAQQQAETNQKTFNKNVKDLAEAAVKIDKDFSDKIDAVCEETSPIPARMIGILADLDNKNGGAVLAHLANNVEEYEEIIELSNERMAIRLDKLSDKLKPQKRATTRSKLPDPNTPIRENNNVRDDVLPAKPTENMEDFVRVRSAQAAEYRKRHFR